MNTLLSKYLYFLDRHNRFVLLAFALITAFMIFSLKDISFDANWRIWYTKDALEKFDKYVDEFAYDDAVVIAFKDYEGIFTPNAVQSLQRITQKLESLKYFSKVDSLVNYQYVYANNDELITQDFLRDANDLATIQAKKKLAENEANLVGRLLSKDMKSTLVIAKLGNNIGKLDIDPSHEISDAVHKIIEEEKQFNNYRFYLHGGTEVNMAFEKLAVRDALIFTPLIFISILTLLYFVFRSASGVMVPIAVIVLTTVWTLGIQTILGHRLNNFTANIPLFIVAIGLADSIHIYSAFMKTHNDGLSHYDRVLQVLIKNIKPLFLTSLTTAIGFYSLQFSPVEPVRFLGESIAMAIVLAFFITIVLVPAVLLKSKQICHEKSLQINFEPLNNFIFGSYKAVIVFFGIIGIVMLYGLKFITVDSNLIKYFDEKVSIRESLSFIQNNISGPVTYEIIIDSLKDGGIKEPEFLTVVDKFENELKAKYPEIKNTFSILQILKQTNKAIHDNNNSFYTLPKTKEQISQYLLTYELSIPSGSNIQDLKNIQEQSMKMTVFVDILGTKKDLEIIDWAEKWWEANGIYKAEMSGSYALFAKMQNAISMTLIYSLLSTFILLAIVFVFAFGNISKLYIYLLPNILPLAIAFGAMGWLDISIDLGIALSAAIIISIAVDDTLHFLSKFYQHKNNGFDAKQSVRYAYANAGVAIIFTTVVVGFSFALFALSDFSPNKDFGVITTLGLLFALIFDLVLLPALLYFGYRKQVHV